MSVKLHVWPPAEWCATVSPDRTFICDQPRGHKGDHEGPEMPTVTIDDPTATAAGDEGGAS